MSSPKLVTGLHTWQNVRSITHPVTGEEVDRRPFGDIHYSIDGREVNREEYDAELQRRLTAPADGAESAEGKAESKNPWWKRTP